MKVLSLGAFMLVVASAVSLVAGGRSKQLLDEGWSRASDVLPGDSLRASAATIPAYTARFFELLPLSVREKLESKMWSAVQVVVFRLFLAWHVAPAFLIAALIGFAEGRWARATQKGLVRIHSPMRFSLATGGLAVIPVLILLWVTAPLMLPVTALVSSVSAVTIFSLRNLIVHAPTQF